jgi:hypothetical protein
MMPNLVFGVNGDQGRDSQPGLQLLAEPVRRGLPGMRAEVDD